MITTDPYVSVAGVTASIHADADVVFTDSFGITWGRGGVLDKATPATASVRLLDRSPGATVARRTDLLGAELLLGYMKQTGTDTIGPSTSFRGRITDVAVERRAAGGYRVSVAASSREVEAANYVAAEGASWPAETFAARRDRIAGLLPASLFRAAAYGGPVVLPARADWGLTDVPDPALDFGTYTVGPASPGGTDALSLLAELFASISPLPMVYDPGLNVITFAGRRRFPYVTKAGTVVTSSLVASPARGGLYVPSAWQGYDLDAHDVDTLGTLEQPIDSRLTRVEVTYLNSAASYASATVTAATADAASEATIGRRTLSVASIHADTAHAQQLANMYRDLAGAEARAPRLGPLSYRTAVNGGFTSTGQRDALLNGAESTSAFFVGRSFLPDLGVRPIVGVVGGSISYGGGDWSLTLNPAPVAVDSPWAPLPVKWAPPGVRLRDLHPSLTFGDAAYLDAGPPGWQTT